VLAVIEANNMIVPIAGFLIVGLIGVIAWTGKRWLTNFDVTTKKILTGLDDIKVQIADLRTENQLQTAALREIETRVETRIQGIERRLEDKRRKINKLDERVTCLESDSAKIKIYHKQNHPNDVL